MNAKPSRREDVTSILSIAAGTAVAVGLTAVLSLREPEVRAMPAMAIPDNYRAVSLPVEDGFATSGRIRAGSRVDVLVTHRTEVEPVARVVLRDVEVLANHRTIARRINGNTEQTPIVTLLVTPPDAEKLAMAETEGRLQLAVRAPSARRESGLLWMPRREGGR
jgi:Flp pilus assembly protein CpaB